MTSYDLTSQEKFWVNVHRTIPSAKRTVKTWGRPPRAMELDFDDTPIWPPEPKLYQIKLAQRGGFLGRALAWIKDQYS